ncbi:hypothetical protein AAFP35_00120 [Gordonia sp. CPCC 206044]|uniref:Rv1733c family protein n=1 Tax=Gordonia sp. CPCC 206044 TaxID=3140793 RepID=UPI003AF37EDA
MTRSSGWTPRRRTLASLVSRNPLIRRVDRIEALMVCLAFALALVAIPLAVSVQGGMYDSRMKAMSEQAQTIHPVQATAVDNSSGFVSEGQNGGLVTARWTYRSVPHTETVHVDDVSTERGDRFTVWVDDNGASTHAPITASDARLGAVVVGIAFYAAMIAVCFLLVMAVRKIGDRFRRRGWDTDLALLTGSGDGRLRRH